MSEFWKLKMNTEHSNNPTMLHLPEDPSEPKTSIEHESITVSPERYIPLAQLVSYCVAIFTRPEARKRILTSVTLFIKRGLDRYPPTDF